MRIVKGQWYLIGPPPVFNCFKLKVSPNFVATFFNLRITFIEISKKKMYLIY